MKTPSLEEVKEYFKNANRVQSIHYKEEQFIPNLDTITIFENTIECKDGKGCRRNLYYKGKYAEILSYKDKTYQLSEKFVKELIKEPNIKEAFIREGIIENDKFEVGKWYKYTDRDGFLVYCEEVISESQIKGYGKSFAWSNSRFWVTNNLTLATPQEVETALIDEAKKRGYENLKHNCLVASNLKINNPCKEYIYRKNKLWIGTEENANCIFHNGVWAEIIDETIEIKKSVILNTPNDLELGKLIRKMV